MIALSVENKSKHTFQTTTAILILSCGTALILLGVLTSAFAGSADLHWNTVWQALLHPNPDEVSHKIIRELRIPRSVASVMVGVCFAVAGAIMQGLTRNPLASPSLLGVNAGASFVLALCIVFFPNITHSSLIIFSFMGAAMGAGLVYGMGSLSRGGMSPMRLALAGAVVTALLESISAGVAIFFDVKRDIAFWYAGGVAGTKWAQIYMLLPWLSIGLIGAIWISRSITIMSLGEETAQGLGQRTLWVKILGMLIVLALAGMAVSVVGPVGFVGLIIPHITRFLVGGDYRLVIPCAAVLGGVLLVWADVASRIVNPPYETPIGVFTSVVGIPIFFYLVRKSRRELT